MRLFKLFSVFSLIEANRIGRSLTDIQVELVADLKDEIPISPRPEKVLEKFPGILLKASNTDDAELDELEADLALEKKIDELENEDTEGSFGLSEELMNRKFAAKIDRGEFNERTYKQCIADELLKLGYTPKVISSSHWIFEYELGQPSEMEIPDIESKHFVDVTLFDIYGNVFQKSVNVSTTAWGRQRMKLEFKDVYRLDYNMENAILLTFKKFAFYPIVVNDFEARKMNSQFRTRALSKYGNCKIIKPAFMGLKLVSSIIDCDDITSGFFAYSEIRFGRPSDYSEECFRKWDSRNLFNQRHHFCNRHEHCHMLRVTACHLACHSG